MAFKASRDSSIPRRNRKQRKSSDRGHASKRNESDARHLRSARPRTQRRAQVKSKQRVWQKCR